MTENQIEESPYLVIKCVVCNSFGTLKYGTVTCHGCHGKGFIVIDKMTGLPVEGKGGQNDE